MNVTACAPTAFHNLTGFGLNFKSITAAPVTNYIALAPPGYPADPSTANATVPDFCNVTVTWGHDGWNDTVRARVYLPLNQWNGRLQGVGGSGLSAGLDDISLYNMAGAVGQGFTAVTTDGGHTSNFDAGPWALSSPGNLNWPNMVDFSYQSLREMTDIAKSLSGTFYGRRPAHAYFQGCSQGGRQALELAQRYPDAYDGIAAGSPAIHVPQFLIADYWPQFVMNQLKAYPPNCELNAITLAAIAACDADDGVRDGVLLNPDVCSFEAKSVVGQPIANCSDTGRPTVISQAAATVAQAAWDGPTDTNGTRLWPGFSREAVLTGPARSAGTRCTPDGQCIGDPSYLSLNWINYFVVKDPTFDPAAMTHDDYVRIFKASVVEFNSVQGTESLDLSEFKRNGGKIMSFQGLADEVISPKGIEDYYNKVSALSPDVHDYFRLFESPGLGHCYGGNGAYPAGMFASLIDWVEHGKAPDTQVAQTTVMSTGFPPGTPRLLCPYPQYAKYDGKGDARDIKSYACAEPCKE